MTIQDFLREATKTLEQADVPSARLDCLILMENSLGLDRAAILAHPETKIPTKQLALLNKQITQRKQHKPLAYIRGRAPFFGREFIVDERVLVPRPETETMIELLKKLPLTKAPRIADIGTGSGCIGITAALEIKGSRVVLYDIDNEALEVAKKNAEDLRADISILKSDLLEDKPGADVILTNLPYVPERYAINRAAEHEPKHAIFSGKDGLGLYRKLWEQIADMPNKPGYVLTESLPMQHPNLASLAKNADYQQTDAQDFIQVFKNNPN